jgi:cell shape-determining protein MreC
MTDENSEQKLSKAEQLKQENDLLEKELARKEELNAKMSLAGNTNAGQVQQVPKVETPKEYADKVMSGQVKAS